MDAVVVLAVDKMTDWVDAQSTGLPRVLVQPSCAALLTRAPPELRQNSSLDDAHYLRLYDLEEPHHQSAGVDLPAGDSSTWRDYGSTAGQESDIKKGVTTLTMLVWSFGNAICVAVVRTYDIYDVVFRERRETQLMFRQQRDLLF